MFSGIIQAICLTHVKDALQKAKEDEKNQISVNEGKNREVSPYLDDNSAVDCRPKLLGIKVVQLPNAIGVSSKTGSMNDMHCVTRAINRQWKWN